MTATLAVPPRTVPAPLRLTLVFPADRSASRAHEEYLVLVPQAVASARQPFGSTDEATWEDAEWQ